MANNESAKISKPDFPEEEIEITVPVKLRLISDMEHYRSGSMLMCYPGAAIETENEDGEKEEVGRVAADISGARLKIAIDRQTWVLDTLPIWKAAKEANEEYLAKYHPETNEDGDEAD